MAHNLLRSTTLVSFNTLLSRILGFVRDMVFAHYFGAIAGFDAFIVAFKIPNFMRRIFAEGAFSQAFVPVLSEYREKHTHAEVKHFIDHMVGCMCSILFAVVFVCILLAPFLIRLFAPGFGHQTVRLVLATHMLRITFPYLLFISLAALLTAVLNSYNCFGIPAFTPVLLNVCFIVTSILIAPHCHIPVYSLAWATLIAGILQYCFQLPFLKAKKLFPVPRVNFKHSGVARVLKLIVPAIFGVSVAQLSLLLDTIFASFLKVGSVSWLYYSSRLMNFPLGVFGVAIATVILPKLSRQNISYNTKIASKTLDWALRLLLLIAIPAALGMFILAGPILSILFKGGSFTKFDVLMARQSLMAFSLGIPAFMLIKVFASAFYARQNIRTPVLIASFAMVINIVLNLILMFPLAHAGLALSASITGILNASLLLFFLLIQKIYIPQTGWIKFLLRIMFANICMIVALFTISWQMVNWFDNNRLKNSIYLFGLITLGVIIYSISLYAFGMRTHHLGESNSYGAT